MSGPQDPTTPPPRPPRLPRMPEKRHAATGDSEPTERIEDVLQRLREVSDLFERTDRKRQEEISDLRTELETAHSTIRRLTRAQSDSVHDDVVTTETIAALSRTMRVEIQKAVEETLAAKASAAGADTASTVARSQGRSTLAKSGVLSAIIAGVVVGILSFAQKTCADVPPAGSTTPPAAAEPVRGPGYGGRP